MILETSCRGISISSLVLFSLYSGHVFLENLYEPFISEVCFLLELNMDASYYGINGSMNVFRQHPSRASSSALSCPVLFLSPGAHMRE